MTVHLAGFVYGACDYEGAIPVKLSIADSSPVTNQSVDTSDKNRKHSQLCSLVCKIDRCYECIVQYKWWHTRTNGCIYCSRNDIVRPSWRNVPYSNGVVKGASNELTSHCVKGQREDLCSVTLDEIKKRALSLTVSFLFPFTLPLFISFYVPVWMKIQIKNTILFIKISIQT